MPVTKPGSRLKTLESGPVRASPKVKAKPGKGWRDPYWLRERLMRKVILPLLFRRNTGIRIVRESWDNLILLDACRYDAFQMSYLEAGLPGVLESRVSRGTETTAFLEDNFLNGPPLTDVVYVTGNPNVSATLNDRFFRVIPVWKDGWDAEWKTVLPEVLYRRSLEAMSRYPTKRLIIHFMQPHRPFIGYPYPYWWKRRPVGPKLFYVWGTMNERGRSWLSQADKHTLFDLYRKNLRLALPHVKGLLEALPGKTVVTSDHGEAFGERLHPLLPFSVYGHPGGTRIKALTKVPWLAHESSSERKLDSSADGTAGEQLTREEEELIGQRLGALGYT